ncbi:unnamed protein product [Microthlaspi erraticum]|uniref:Uncharacterized protein n=1 Tax=Microthlaspi erraticum TaxID=1685480 RepID=A0A6D2LA72_9BRAS|nr:unnamed protein product [Microthlaspi erraticum]
MSLMDSLGIMWFQLTTLTSLRSCHSYYTQSDGCLPVWSYGLESLPPFLFSNFQMRIMEVKLGQGLKIIKIFKEHSSKTCILDDSSLLRGSTEDYYGQESYSETVPEAATQPSSDLKVAAETEVKNIRKLETLSISDGRISDGLES